MWETVCRCIFDRAPPNVARTIKVEADLEDQAVKSLRPTHKQPYTRVRRAMNDMSLAGESELFAKWEKLDLFCTSFFKDPGAKKGEGSRPASRAKDYRDEVKTMMKEKAPCLVLLCSPPGAGKSHFSDILAEEVRLPSISCSVSLWFVPHGRRSERGLFS